jgi:predicted RND superfamily exporter protein
VDRFLRSLSNHPWLLIALLVIFTALAANQLVDFESRRFRLEIDVSANRLLPEGDEGKKFYDFARKVFGSDETMLVALHADNIFTRKNLARVKRLTQRIGEIDGVHHVVSLSNALNILGTEDGLDIRPFVGEVPENPEELASIRQEALSNPIYAGNLISRDGKTAALLVYFLDFSDREFIERGIDDRIAQIAREEAGDGQVWLSGGPHLKVAQVRYQLGDLARNLPLIGVVLAVVLLFSFRTVRGMVLPLLTVGIALLWTMGVAAWIGRPLNLVTILIPPLLMILGVSYSVHVVSEYYDVLRHEPESTSRQGTHRALGLVWLPVALTGLTTAAGFLALASSPMGAIREFGVLSLVGVVLTVVASLTVPTALLSVLGKPRRLGHAAREGPDLFARFSEWAGHLNLRHRRAILVTAALTFAVAVAAFTQIKVGSDSIENFPGDSTIRRDFDAVNVHLEGANSFNIVLEASERDGFLEPQNLREIEGLQAWLEAQPEIGGTTSIVDYLALINRGFHENDPAYLTIPKSKRLTGQLLFFGANDELDGFMDRGNRLANVLVRASVFDTELIDSLVARIQRRLDELPAHLEATVTGNPILLNRLENDIVLGQAKSIVWALVLIYGILTLMFLSPRIGLIALIPNVVPIAFYFGALGLSGITLNPATSLIAPMTLGIAIDDTIHYFARFNLEAKRMADERLATVATLRAVGRPVTYTSIAICAGFLVLATSDLQRQVELGALGALTLAFAWLADFTLTPALCSGLRVVTLWDTLTLDLGDEPQRSIPIFEGLSKAQCRIVALMARVLSAPAGARLIKAGEQGQEMYVVIDGTLRVWAEGRDGPIELGSSGRGDVIGEVGLFYRSRSANVDVVDDARLLRLTQSNLERLGRRYPRIASRVFRNLTEVLAERLWKTTGRLR